MRVLTWLPPDLRERVAALDPARDMAVPDRPALHTVLLAAHEQPAGTPVSAAPARPHRPHRPRRFLLASAVAVLVLIAGAITLVQRSWSPSGRSHNDRSPAAGQTADTEAIARQFADFPVHATPRPVVLLGSAVETTGLSFRDEATALAFKVGQLHFGSAPPQTPTTLGGYPVLHPAEAFEQSEAFAHGTAANDTVLVVTGATLVEHQFVTDRGSQSLPAWELTIDGVHGQVYLLAVAAAGRYPQTPGGSGFGGPPATLGADGRSLTIWFTANHPSSGPCDPGYTSTLHVQQTDTVVVVDTVQHLQPMSSDQPRICDAIGHAPPQEQPVPGAAETATIHLDMALGNRIVVNGQGQPYRVGPR